MTKEEALRFIMPFGKYKGQTLGHILGEDIGYLEWCYENLDERRNPRLFEAITLLYVLG